MFPVFLAVALVLRQNPGPPINGGLPSVSPDGKYIAFVSARSGNQEVFVMGSDGSDQRQVTRATGRVGMPSWAPDGKRILFQAMTRDSVTLYAILPSGDGLTRLGSYAGHMAALAPDGRRVGVSTGVRMNQNYIMSDLDGAHPDTVVRGPGIVVDPAWSPDGKQIAYAFVDTTRSMRMWLVKSDWTGRRPVAEPTDSGAHPQWGRWSPDGKRLVVQAGIYGAQGSTAHLWLIEPGTGKVTKLAPHREAYLDETPAWFPDGKRIAFQSDRTGRMEVWAMNADGTGAQQLTQAAVAAPGAANADAITGMWDGTMGPADSPKATSIMFHITFDGKSVSGSVEGGTGTIGTVTNGTYDPQTGALKLEIDVPGEVSRGLFEGMVKDGVARGKVTIGAQIGQFELTRKG